MPFSERKCGALDAGVITYLGWAIVLDSTEQFQPLFLRDQSETDSIDEGVKMNSLSTIECEHHYITLCEASPFYISWRYVRRTDIIFCSNSACNDGGTFWGSVYHVHWIGLLGHILNTAWEALETNASTDACRQLLSCRWHAVSVVRSVLVVLRFRTTRRLLGSLHL